LIDASIAFDEDNGRFSYLDSNEVHALLNASERSLLNASIQLDTGL
jgi:hypothetical protein